MLLDDGAFGGNELAGGVVFVDHGFGGTPVWPVAQNASLAFLERNLAAIDGLVEFRAVTVFSGVRRRFNATAIEVGGEQDGIGLGQRQSGPKQRTETVLHDSRLGGIPSGCNT